MKTFIALLPAVLIFLNSFSQATVKWQKTVGGNDYDALFSLVFTADSGFLVGGSSSSGISGEKTDSSRGYDDYWIVKFNSSGIIQFDKTFGGDNFDDLTAMQPTDDGGYILGGTSASDIFAEKSEDSRGGYDYWIIKIDKNGNKEWDKTLGGSSDDQLQSLIQTSDGGYLLGGPSYSHVSGEKTGDSRGYLDYWIVKLDKAGNIQWDKTMGGKGYDILNAVAQVGKHYFVAGYSDSPKSYEKSENSRGGSLDYWALKLDENGNVMTDKTIGGKDADYLHCAIHTKDGGGILGGSSQSNISGEKTQNSRGKRDYWIVKLNDSGEIEWDKTMGGKGHDDLSCIAQTGDGGYILGGSSESNISGEKTENSKGTRDYWVVKLDSAGNVEWDKTIGGSSYDNLIQIKQTGKNKYLLAGYSASNKTGDKTQYSRGGHDYWIVKLEYTPGGIIVSDKTIVATQANDFSVYPNPAKNMLYIQSNVKANFILSNVSGKVYRTVAVESKGSIDLKNIPAGTYFLTNTTTGKKQNVIIEK
jgi:hypothetical protein